MPSHRFILVAGFGLITLTTLWFGFSATPLEQASRVVYADVPAVNIAARSTCQVTLFETLVETVFETVVATSTAVAAAATAQPSSPVAAQASHSHVPDSSLAVVAPFSVSEDVAPPAGAESADDDDEADTAPSHSVPPPPSTPTSLSLARPAISPTNDEDFDLSEVLTKYACFPASTDEVRAIARDTAASLQFNVVRGDNLLLSRKPKLVPASSPGSAGAPPPFKEWRSIGRKPSPGCWTYSDRFRRYRESTSPRFLRTLGAVNQCNEDTKRAIVIHIQKGQSFNAHFSQHLSALVAEAGWLSGLHVYLLIYVDGTEEDGARYVADVVPEAFRPLAITFTAADLRATLGEDAPFEGYETNTHVAVQKFMKDKSDYEFVYFVAAGTRLVGRWDQLLKTVEAEYAFHRELGEEVRQMPSVPDLLTFEAPREPEKEWPALELACLQFFQGADAKLGTVRRSLSAMGGFSRRMIDALAELNTQNINCRSDYFPPTAAAHMNLTTFFYQHPLYTAEAPASAAAANAVRVKTALNDAITVQLDSIDVDFTYSTDTKDAQSFWEEWVENEEVCRPEALLHPITGQY